MLGFGLTEAQGRTPQPQIGQSAQLELAAVAGQHDTVYHAIAQQTGFHMMSEAQRVSATFTSRGTAFQHADHRFGMAFRAWGYGEALHELPCAPPRASANRVEYDRGSLIEWYVNTPLGIEQGFTVAKRPSVHAAGPLTVALTLSGALTPELDKEARTLKLSSNGTAKIRYSGLTAVDAAGRHLRSWLELAGRELRLRVDDSGAQYPVTIDPYVQVAKLTMMKRCVEGGVCDDGGEGSSFGRAVAVSADGGTVAVGALGAVYIFLRPAVATGGWSSPTPIYFAAKLQPPSTNPSFDFGFDVAMTPDASTIVVGTPEYYNNSSVYVFQKPAAGWASSTPLVPLARLTCWLGANANQMGAAVSISADGKTIAAGAPTATFAHEREGAVYVYVKPYTGWVNSTENQRITLNFEAKPYNGFGDSVALSADATTMVIGMPYYGGPGTGSAYVFTGFNNWGTLSQETKLVATDSTGSTKFGGTVAINADGSTIAVSASGCTRGFFCGDFPGNGPGAVYMYTRPDTGWYSSTPRTQNAKLTSSMATSNNRLGTGVALNTAGTVLAATDSTISWTAPGAVNVYMRPGNGWANGTENVRFNVAESAYSVDMTPDATTLVAGSLWATVGTNQQEGVTYVFAGSASAPAASVSPSSLSFNAQPVGTATTSQTVTVTNTGTAPLNVTAVSTSAPYSGTQNCKIVSPIAPGSSCTETVSFAPMSVGAITGTLTFTNDSGGTAGAQQTVQLQGNAVKAATVTVVTAVTPSTALAGKPVSIAFSAVPESTNALPVSGTVTVRASTGESCTGAGPVGSCAITFQTAGDRTLTATYNGDANFTASTSASRTVRIMDYTLSVAPASQTLTGRKANYTVTVSAVNGFAGTVALSCSGGPAGTTCSMSPASVAVNGSSLQATATVTLPTKAASGVYTITFTGAATGSVRSATGTLTVK
jgi:hypothetical protein